MPDRYISEGLLRSDAWNSLTSAEAQLLFIRLLLLVDDFGCWDGRDDMITNHVFPAGALGEEERMGITDMLRELQRVGLIIRYSNRGKPFIAITQWRNDLRGARKFPAPPLDVDLEGLKVRGKFGGPIGWSNPAGYDPVSILLDNNGKAVVPQPPEWRPDSHMRPVMTRKSGWRLDTGSVSQAASHTPHDTSGPSHAVQSSSSYQSPEQSPEQSPDVVAKPQQPHVTTAATTPTNGGIIEYRQGRFVGLSEEQRVKWQAMFDELRIPDQIDRAAAWLEVHDDERGAIERQGLGFAQFIVRWLLREVRSPHTGAAP